MNLVKVLIVDSDLAATEDLQVRLLKFGYKVVGTATTSEEAVLKSARLKPSLILMNTRLRTGSDGIKTGKLIHLNNNIPIVYVSSRAGQDTIRQASSTGPFGYIIKPFDDAQLFVTLEIAQVRFGLESQLRESRQWLNGVLMSIGDGVIAVDPGGIIRFINSRAAEITEWNETAAIGKLLLDVLKIIDEPSGQLLDLSSNFTQAGGVNLSESGIEAMLITNTGNRKPLEISFSPIIDQDDNFIGMVLAFRDITSRRNATEVHELLKWAGQQDFILPFYLAGGTALALQVGHRKSVDLDFFSQIDEVHERTRQQIIRAIAERDGQVIENVDGNLVLLVDDVRVGFFSDGYKLLEPFEQLENVNVASMLDIGLMKLDAVIGRGSRKDFFDLYAIAEKYPLEGLLQAGARKYPTSRDFALMAVESFILFENAEHDVQPKLMIDVTWDEVREYFSEQAKLLGKKWFRK